MAGVSFPGEEEKILKHWEEINAFHRQLELTKDKEPWVFYDGPPFATGTPHYGHLLASTIKDVIPRFWAMKGRHVERRFGWDTHGVPIEQIIDTQLQSEIGVRGREAVEKIGIAEYNRRCREIVLTYADVWRQVIGRLGRWIDFDNDYKTMDHTFQESCWWVFKQLFEKKLVYHGSRVLPYSMGLNTPLSKSEAGEDYRDVSDPAVVVAFPLRDTENHPDTSFLIWTTTPWTLPSNIAVCAHPELDYIKIHDEKRDKKFILGEGGLKTLYKDPKKAKFKILTKFRGKELLGWKYHPPFDYYWEEHKDHWFHMLNDEYVKEGDSTGIVHQASCFGEDDARIAWRDGLVSDTRSAPDPLDPSGNFIEPVKEFIGVNVKAADKGLMKDLEKRGLLIERNQIIHSYPFCPRSKTPLIQRAVPSWFIQVENVVPQLLENLDRTHWTPLSVKEGRFRNWLASARDWNVSRNRYWGTPIPLWVSDDLKERVCIGSVEELKKLSGFEGDITDLHREHIDSITIPSQQGKGELKRIEAVFDCWFESGSMPYASSHYPFNQKYKQDFHNQFPGDFIAEGMDQTRGWFYSLHVLGTHLFNTAPYKNVVVNGIVLAENGKKMSKSLKNFPDPSKVLKEIGSDALRLYMINSPVVRGENLRFSEQGVRQVVTSVLLPLWNSMNFFLQQVELLKKLQGIDFMWNPESLHNNQNIMDRWILAECQSLIQFVNKELGEDYKLYTVVPRLLELLEQTTNWYIRFNRTRLKGAGGVEDTQAALNTLFEVIYTQIRSLAPFIPFITENIFQRIRKHIPESHAEQDMRSIHFLRYPTVRDDLFDEIVERRVHRMQAVIQQGRLARERRVLPIKTPLKTFTVIHSDPQFLEDVRGLQNYIIDELNIVELHTTSDEKAHGVVYNALPDIKSLGIKFKKNAAPIKKALPSLSAADIKSFMETGKITVAGCELVREDLRVRREIPPTDANEHLEVAIDEDNSLLVILDTIVYPELAPLQLAREIVNRVQKLRKTAGLVPTDDIRMTYRVVQDEDGEIESMFGSQRHMFNKAVQGEISKVAEGAEEGKGEMVGEEEAEVRGLVAVFKLWRM